MRSCRASRSRTRSSNPNGTSLGYRASVLRDIAYTPMLTPYASVGFSLNLTMCPSTVSSVPKSILTWRWYVATVSGAR